MAKLAGTDFYKEALNEFKETIEIVEKLNPDAQIFISEDCDYWGSETIIHFLLKNTYCYIIIRAEEEYAYKSYSNQKDLKSPGVFIKDLEELKRSLFHIGLELTIG
jgi:hypothetical protein